MVSTRHNNRKVVTIIHHIHTLHLIVTIGVAPRVLVPHTCANYARPFMKLAGLPRQELGRGEFFYCSAPSRFSLLCALDGEI
jgi:hypothetical protein